MLLLLIQLLELLLLYLRSLLCTVIFSGNNDDMKKTCKGYREKEQRKREMGINE